MTVDHSIQATPRSEPANIPLPQPRPADAARPPRSMPLLDATLVALLLILAFLLGSFPARNSDLWMHLATGKRLLAGAYQFGTDPFAHTTRDVYWVNHAWVFDALVYELYNALGGPSLVILKALVLVLIAGVLLRNSILSEPGASATGGYLLPVACTLLAVLAISRWMLVQPVAFSYLFFALTVWFLERPRRLGRDGSSWTAYWPLLPLFVVWVNVDDWFLLGPATVAVYLIRSARSEKRALAVVLVAGLIACLLNPHHVRAFVVPWQLGLSQAGRVLRQNPQFRGLFLSPVQGAYFRTDTGLNAAGLAYFAIIALSVLAIVLNWRGWRWRHLLLAVAMLALSLFSARAIPFFAIAAAPMIAVNVQQWLARRGEASTFVSHHPWRTGGRLLAMLGGVLLLAAAWPGWLGPPPFEPRRWEVESDDSFARVAQQLAEWREAGKLPPGTRGLNLSVDAANYMAFYSSEEKTFFDQRLPLFSRETASAFLGVRRAIAGANTTGEASGTAAARGDPAGNAWRDILRRWDVNYVIIHETNDERGARLFRRLMANRAEWFPLILDGRTAVFGWQDPQRPQRAMGKFPALALDLRRRAFHPSEEERAPRQWPGRDPEPRTWLDAFTQPAPSRSPRTDEARFYLDLFDDQKPIYFDRTFRRWTTAQAANFLALLNAGDAPLLGPLGQSLRNGLNGIFLLSPVPTAPAPGWRPTRMQLTGRQLMNMYFIQQDEAPMYLPLLAIRAARRAIHANPDDAYAYLTLGEAYIRLAQQTRERRTTAGQRMEYLKRIRQLQAITAFSNALTLNPDLAQAHFQLANLYTDLRMVDLVLKHRQEYLRLTQAAGPRPGETSAAFQDRLAPLEQQVEQLDADVRELLNVFEVNSQNLKAGEKAQRANLSGLGGKALEVLLASDITAFGKEGLELELTLLLTTGRIREFRAWFAPEHKADLGAYGYQWFRIYLAAASGDYEAADREFAELEPPAAFRDKVAKSVAQVAIDRLAQNNIPGFAFLVARRSANEMLALLDRWTLQQLHRADLIVVRGLLAMEQGDTDKAAALFQQAIAVAQAATPDGKAEFSGRMLADACREMLAP